MSELIALDGVVLHRARVDVLHDILVLQRVLLPAVARVQEHAAVASRSSALHRR